MMKDYELQKGEPHTVSRSRYHTKRILLWTFIFCCLTFYNFPWPHWPGSKQQESLELTIPDHNYGPLLQSSVLFELTFANSWGKPLSVAYTPPDIEFNRVMLKLSTQVNGTQYSRMAHFFINEVPIWRSSTVESGNGTTKSTATKDVSVYLSQFQKEGNITIQLNNALTSKLNGAFHIKLEVKYYNHIYTRTSGYLDAVSEPASEIIKFIPHREYKTPLVYYPVGASNHRLSYALPKFSSATVISKLMLYAHGNAAEEYWYSNVLDKHVGKFSKHGHELLGHGPLRYINVYIDDQLVSQVAPQPVVFPGGIAPSLWKPVVGYGAFDLQAYEVDISTLLPLFWEGEHLLSLEVVSTPGKQHEWKSTVGENWVISGSILNFFSNHIKSVTGVYLGSEHVHNMSITSDHGVDFLHQEVNATSEVTSRAEFTYHFDNGTTSVLELVSVCDSNVVNHQRYRDNGDKQMFAASVESSQHIKMFDKESHAKLMDYHTIQSSPFSIDLHTLPITGPEVTYDVSLSRHVKDITRLNSRTIFELSASSSGDADYKLGPHGKTGTGDAAHSISVFQTEPLGELQYKRTIIVKDNKIVSDNRE